jgi:hypothetical protein
MEPEPKAEPASAAIHLTWAKAYEQRQCNQRIAGSLKRAEARIAAQTIAATGPPHPTASPPP